MKFIIALAFFAISCTPASSPEAGPLSPKPLVFDYLKVTELSIVKHDAKTGLVWSATVAQTGGAWTIKSAPEGQKLVDTRADSQFIQHLLDTLQSLQAVSTFSPDTMRAKASLGLEPPSILLRWSVPNESGVAQIFEAQLADVGEDLSATDSSTVAAYFPHLQNGGMVKGAALQMLRYLDSFDVLRQRKLSLWTSEPVEGITLKKKAHVELSAQRRSGNWKLSGPHPLRADIPQLLEGLVHARIQKFVDEPDAAQRLQTLVLKKPLYQVTLRDRDGGESVLSFTPAPNDPTGGFLATNSLRPDGVYLVHPGIRKILELKP